MFGDVNDFRCALLKQSAQYYVNGTKDGFLKYKNSAGNINTCFFFIFVNNIIKCLISICSGWKQKNRKTLNAASKEVDMDTSRLASEANQPEVNFGFIELMKKNDENIKKILLLGWRI